MVENAFDFLETAINEFEDKPKYSVIHFSTAIELILKARLIHEHWSLIVAEEPNIKKFNSGDFMSIGFKKIIPRINNVLGEKIHIETQKCFENIAKHRNKVIHFYHEASSQPASEKDIDTIVIEQCNGWYYLKKLFNKWDDVFGKYNGKISTIDFRIKRYQTYLNVAYQRIKPEIDKEKEQGYKFKECRSCHLEASKEEKLTDLLYKYECKICSFDEFAVKVLCPECKNSILITEDSDSRKCNSCNREFSQDELWDALDTEMCEPYDYVSKNCAACMGSGSVVFHNDYYVCTECINICREIYLCEWCNEYQIDGGDLKWSYISGCEFCEGQAGWTKDD